MDVREFIRLLDILIRDEFVAITQEKEDGLTVSFLNRESFRITVEKDIRSGLAENL